MNDAALFCRQSRLVEPSFREAEVMVIGAGMVGSWTALLLARQVHTVSVWDDDIVSLENLGTQAFNDLDVGLYKVTAIERQTFGIGNVVVRSRRFPEPGIHSSPMCEKLFVVSAVDSMEGRRRIAEWCRDEICDGFIDGRVLGEIAARYFLTSSEDYDWYLENKMPSDEDVPPVTCGATGTPYVGMWLASRIVATLNNHCKGIPERRELVWHVGLNQDIVE